MKTTPLLLLFLLFYVTPSFAGYGLSDNYFNVPPTARLCPFIYVYNISEPAYQNITVRVLNTTLSCVDTPSLTEVTGAYVNATMTNANSTTTAFDFVEKGSGNYTYNYSFSVNGTYTLKVQVTRASFDNETATESIYVGTIIESFNMSPTSAYTDETVYFTTEIRNQGESNLVTVTAFLNIYMSNGTFIEAFNFTGLNSTMLPGYEATSTKEKIFSTYSAGTYVAEVEVNYTYGAPYTWGGSGSTRLNESFNLSIRPAAPPPGGGGGGGGGQIRPPAAPFKFKKYPILREVAPGQSIVVDTMVTNPTARAHKFRAHMEGIPDEWVEQESEEIDLGPGESRIFTIGIRVPADERAVDRLTKLRIKAGATTYDGDFFVLRSKPYPTPYHQPTVFRSVDVDFVDDVVEVRVTVRNKDRRFKSVELYERISKQIAQSVDEIEFETPPTEIIERDPLVMWRLDDLEPDETREIRYTVNRVIDQYEPYVYWSVEQINIIREKLVLDKILISQVFISPLLPGQENFVSFDLRNTFTLPISVVADLWLPVGWMGEPEKFELVIAPKGMQNITFKILLPEEVRFGTYAGALHVVYENYSVTKEITLNVGGGMGVTGFALGFLYSRWVLLIMIIVVGTLIIRAVVRRKREGDVYKADRLNTLKEIKDVVWRRR